MEQQLTQKELEQRIRERNAQTIAEFRVQRIKEIDLILAQLKKKTSKVFRNLSAERQSLMPKHYTQEGI